MTTEITVRFGANNIKSTNLRFTDAMDAIVRFSEAVVRLDSDPEAWAAWATLDAPGGGNASWTKVSNERPTSDGEPFNDD